MGLSCVMCFFLFVVSFFSVFWILGLFFSIVVVCGLVVMYVVYCYFSMGCALVLEIVF